MKIETIANVKQIDELLICHSKAFLELVEGDYLITIENIPRKRTLRQNKYLWALIGEIAKAEDGNIRNIDDIYATLLEMSGSKYEIIIGTKEGIEALKKYGVIRHIKVIKEEIVNHNVMLKAMVFYGSSKMTTEEFSRLIETTLDYANEIGIETGTWRELLK